MSNKKRWLLFLSISTIFIALLAISNCDNLEEEIRRFLEKHQEQESKVEDF
jgi:hypothetical protein